MPIRFKNPLELSGEYNKDLHGRVQVDMPKEDLYFFQSINPARGVMQTTINILLVKLQEQLKSHGITTVTQCREYCDFVNNLRLSDGRVNPVVSINGAGSTAPGSLPQASAPNVGGRKTRTPRKGA